MGRDIVSHSSFIKLLLDSFNNSYFKFRFGLYILPTPPNRHPGAGLKARFFPGVLNILFGKCLYKLQPLMGCIPGARQAAGFVKGFGGSRCLAQLKTGDAQQQPTLRHDLCFAFVVGYRFQGILGRLPAFLFKIPLCESQSEFGAGV